MTDLGLILQMGDHFSFAGQRPDEASSVRRRNLLRWPDADLRLMDVRCRLIHDVDQQLDEPVGNDFVIVIVTQLECVVEEDVRFVLVVVRIDNLPSQSKFQLKSPV